MTGRKRRTKAEILADREALSDMKDEETQLKKSQAEEAKKNSVIVDKWYALCGDKLLERSRNAAGSVYSRYIGRKSSKQGTEFIKKLKKQGVTIEAV